LHKLAGHLGGDLISDAAAAIRIGREKPQDFFLVDTGLFEPIKKLPVTHFTAELLDPVEKSFTVAANLAEDAGAPAAINALSAHLVLRR
jgi:hypothetical protein